MANRLDLTLRINGEDRTGPARSGLLSIEQQLTRLRQTASTFLALKVGEIFSNQIGELIKTADAYKTLEARLKLVSDNTSEYAKAQTELFNVAQRTRGDLESTYMLYGRVETAVKRLGGTQELALKTTETINQAIALSGGSAETAKAGIEQFNQALASGVLRGQEFNSVSLNTPALTQAIADGLGVTIGKLRQMAEAGQLTADVLVNGLGKSAGDIASRFAQLPLTISGAMTNLSSAFTMFVGQADKSSGASATLAGGISLLAKNLNTVADVGLLAAEIYGAKLVLGLSRSTQSLIEGAIAARQASAASALLMQQEIRRAEVSVTSSLNLIREAQYQRALAVTETQRAAAMRNLDAAYAQHAANVTLLNTQQAALNQANARSTLSTVLFGGAVGGVARAFALLNVATALAFSAYLGYQVGKWLSQFDAVQYIGANIAEMAAKFVAFGEVMTRPLSVASLRKFSAELDNINSHFDGVREAIGKQPAAIAASGEQTSQALAAAALKQQASFKAVQDAVKALTASIDVESKQQTVLIEQSLTERLAAIDAMAVSEAGKDTLRVTAKLASYQQLAQVQQQASDAKLALIEQEYAKELTQAAANAQRTAEIETQKRQAKLAVYTGLADYYQGEIAKLSQVYATEFQAAQQAKLQLQQLNQSHEQALFDISLMGMNERQQLEAKQDEYNKKILEIKKEQAKGEQADQAKINRLLGEAKTLNADITRSAGTSFSEIQKAKDRENQIYTLQKTLLENNAKDHEKNANRAKAAQAAVAEQLASTQAAITTITDKLNQDYALKIGVDKPSLTAIQSTITELTKPETKTIYIQTVERSGNSYRGGVQEQTVAQAAGGPAGFAGGGWTRRTGFLPGYGGGDKNKALYEDGEFIIRKEAVRAWGVPVMQLVNAGKLPAGGVIKRTFGGLVSTGEISAGARKKQDERDAELVGTMLNNVGFYKSLGGVTDITGRTTGDAMRNMIKTLGSINRGDLVPYIVEGMKDADQAISRSSNYMWGTGTPTVQEQRNEKAALAGADRFNAKKELLMEKIKAGATGKQSAAPVLTPKFSIPQLPEAVTKFNEAAAPKAGSSLVQAAQKTVNVQFAMPGGDPVAGRFNESDIDKLFKTLKDAGLRSSGGHF